MKTATNRDRQGDVYIDAVEAIPADAVEVPREADGTVIIGHSETGHHHYFAKDQAVTLFRTADPFVCYLRMEQPCLLEHNRPNDTHDSILYPAGVRKVTRQRERAYTPEGWRARMVQD